MNRRRFPNLPPAARGLFREVIQNKKGTTLIELLFSVAIMLMIAASFYQLLISFHQNYQIQDAIAEMQQQVRVANDLTLREIRQTGYDPTGILFLLDNQPNINKKTKDKSKIGCQRAKNAAEPIFEATPNVFHYLADLNGNSTVDKGEDVDEDIRYEWIDSSGRDSCGVKKNPFTLYRDSGGSGAQEVALNIEFFQLDYYDENGLRLLGTNGVLSQAQRVKIRKVAIMLRARTDRKDPNHPSNNGYRTRELVSEVWLKNM